MTIQIGQLINQTNIALVILNQARDDLKANPMFPQIKSSGGRALEHWASLRLEVQKASQIKEKVDTPTGGTKDEYVGHIFRVKTKKSKVSTPNKQAEVFLISEPYVGLDFVENIYRSSVDQYGFISKGAWRAYTPIHGDEIKLRDKEWVPFLRSDKGQLILNELFIKQLKTYFPDGFAPFDNDYIDVTKDKHYAIAKMLYDGEDISQYITHEDVPQETEVKKETKTEEG